MPKAGKNLTQILLVLLVGVVGMQIYDYLVSTKPEIKKRAKTAQVWPVEVVTLDFKNHQPELRLFGQTVASRQVELRALVAGEVVETGPGLREGSIVKKNDTLLVINRFDYQVALADAEAALAEAKARLAEIQALIDQERDALRFARQQARLARRDVRRAEKLVKKGSVSKKLLDDRRLVLSQREEAVKRSQNNLKVQKARLGQQRAALKRAQWKLKQARRNLDLTVLKAPFDAYVSEVRAQLGRRLSSNDPVARLYDRHQMDVRFTLSDRQYGRILGYGGDLRGRPVRVLWRVGETPIVYHGKVERVAAQIASNKGGVELFARIDNPLKPMPLRAGAFVEVFLPDRAYEKVASVPQTAVYEGQYVFAVRKGRLKRIKIEVVGHAGDALLIRGEGLRNGSKVLTTRLTVVDDGLPVKIIEPENDAQTRRSAQRLSEVVAPAALKRAAQRDDNIKRK